MFYRRIYYNLTSGTVLDSRMAKGDIRIQTVEEELASFAGLQGYTRSTVGLMEWFEPDATVEAQFEVQMLERIDVTQAPHIMVFVDFPEPEPDELIEALSILGVEVYEDETN